MMRFVTSFAFVATAISSSAAACAQSTQPADISSRSFATDSAVLATRAEAGANDAAHRHRRARGRGGAVTSLVLHQNGQDQTARKVK